MTDSEKLARWQGIDCDCGNCGAAYNRCDCDVVGIGTGSTPPDYLNDDAAAMSLLDTLSERGYKVQLVSSLLAEFVTWDCFVTYAPKQTTSGSMDVQTRREAVVAACLELIGKEDI